MANQKVSPTLPDIYHQLMAHYGPQHWWPADNPLEVIIGAILTQSAAWGNVEKAIINLKAVGALSLAALRQLSLPQLAEIIRPCGYYNAKALKLKSLADWLGEYYHDNLDRLFAGDADSLRQQLLSVYGIGEETADSIILYAANKPVFVIDAYTRRIISRLGLALDSHNYSAYQSFFRDNLPADVRLFNEYHALLVQLAKDVCRKRPICPRCCLNSRCRFYPDANNS